MGSTLAAPASMTFEDEDKRALRSINLDRSEERTHLMPVGPLAPLGLLIQGK